MKTIANNNTVIKKFFAKMSNGMRTPLNAIIGLSEATLEENSLSDKARENIYKISNTGIYLLGLIDNLLDISKIETDKLELVMNEYETASLINDVTAQCIILNRENQIEFSLDIGENIPARLIGDVLRIKQILNNLLSNSFKYTTKGKIELCINCQNINDSYVLLVMRVIDTGIGIKSENMNDLYNEDYNIGLSVTKALVDMMGGTINAASKFGRGSIFTVQIPQKSRPSHANNVIGTETIMLLKNFQYKEKNLKN
jgi:signal transduction histidine kinase